MNNEDKLKEINDKISKIEILNNVESAKGKTIKDISLYRDDLALRFTDDSVLQLRSFVDMDDCSYLQVQASPDRESFAGLGLITEYELDLIYEYETFKQYEQQKAERHALYKKLKQEFENNQ